MSSGRRYISRDGLISVIITQSCLSEMVKMCKTAHGNEIGSVLFGHYSVDGYSVFVDGTRPAPVGSIGKRMSFWRSPRGLASFFRRLFKKSNGDRYYIGEWHLHPGCSIAPSHCDDRTMTSISKDHGSHGVVSIILGGRSCDDPLIGVSVYIGNSRVDLIEGRV